ncbi:zinc ribbon domain-containing protein [Candidatus Dojkabacteria bacterium]|nr:zinc ribbon domain-containing protein [Candidatus Dojkabacteria bacterium]
MEAFEKQCQSCGMPLENGKKSGTEADGSPSKLYCTYCYKDGKFLQPDMTLEEMKKVLDTTIGKEGLKGKFLAFFGKMQLKSLKRWKV